MFQFKTLKIRFTEAKLTIATELDTTFFFKDELKI